MVSFTYLQHCIQTSPTLKHTINLIKHSLNPGFGAMWLQSFVKQPLRHHLILTLTLLQLALGKLAAQTLQCLGWWATSHHSGSMVLLFCLSLHVAYSTIKAANIRCYYTIYAGRKEMFPTIPWKRTFCWRDHLLNLCLSECLLQNSISLHLAIRKKN